MGVMDVLSELDPMALLGKMLGVLIIIGSMLNKAPLFVNILKSKSVTGISSSSIYSEAIMYSNAALYCVRLGHPFTAYGETLLIAAQTLMVIMLMWKFKVEPKISMKERSIVTALFVVYIAVVFAVPVEKIYLLLSINMPVTSEYSATRTRIVFFYHF
jgi:mannose-P-dolichol utilization defect protein 1